MDRGLIRGSRHPQLPLTIYNYTRQCQYDASWDDITLQCRGLILDDQDGIVARGFSKFFNYEELIQRNEIPTLAESCWVQKKMDGSLGILFYYADRWIMATRGSFESEQAEAGLKIAQDLHDLDKFSKGHVYLCEIIYPENRIVVDYSMESRLVFLSAVKDGVELDWPSAVELFVESGISEADIVKTFLMTDCSIEAYHALKREETPNEEGYVIRFCSSQMRMKIKYREYMRLHRLLTNISSVYLWELLKLGMDPSDNLDRVPDEFDEWIRAQIKELNRAYFSLVYRAVKILEKLHAEGFEDRKDQALWIKSNVEQGLQPIIFKLLDGGDPKPMVWKLVKPKHAVPRRNFEEE
jgi:RNA ligase